jgi:hypothetical protein
VILLDHSADQPSVAKLQLGKNAESSALHGLARQIEAPEDRLSLARYPVATRARVSGTTLRECCQSLSAIGIGSMLTLFHHAASSPLR